MKSRIPHARARLRTARELSFTWPLLACLVVLGHVAWVVALWALFVLDNDSSALRYEYSTFKVMTLGPDGISIPTALGLSNLACAVLLAAGIWLARKSIDRKALAGLAMAFVAIGSVQWLTHNLASAAQSRDDHELASVAELRARFELAGAEHEEHAKHVLELLRDRSGRKPRDYIDVWGGDWEWFNAQYQKIQNCSATAVFAPRLRTANDGHILYYIHARNGIADQIVQQGLARCPSPPERVADDFPALDEHRASTPHFVPLRGDWYAFQCRGPIP